MHHHIPNRRSRLRAPLARKKENHRSNRAGWLRAAVLGSDDAIVSTASLMVGVAASSASKRAVLVAGVAGLVAGSMSMAVGEYVSVSSQRDAERADIEVERHELTQEPLAELRDLRARPACCISPFASDTSYSRDCRVFTADSRGSWRIWRSSRRCTDRARGAPSCNRWRHRDGSDRRNRASARRYRGMKALVLSS